MAIKKLRSKGQPVSDLVVDIAKSEDRGSFGVGVVSCLVPNSRPYRHKTSSLLTPAQVHAVQGIFKSDFPAMESWAQERKRLTRDLAGNAFSTTVCMAVIISCLLHYRDGSTRIPAPATPPRSRSVDPDYSPETVGKRKAASTSASPKKRKMGS